VSVPHFLDLGEYADWLRLQGNEWAGEIRDCFDHVEKCEADNVFDDLRHLHPDGPKRNGYGIKDDRPEMEIWRVVEWLKDRSHLVDELRNICTAEGIDPAKDIDDVLKDSLSELAALRNLFEANGLPDGGDLYEFAAALCERPKYDL
jgi:hypothetical protein